MRNPGIGGLQTTVAAAGKDQHRLQGENEAKIRTDLMKEQLAASLSELKEFTCKHKNDFRKNPAFISQFHEIFAKLE